VYTHTSLHILSIPLQAEGFLSRLTQALRAFCERLFLGSDPNYHRYQRDWVILGNHVSSALSAFSLKFLVVLISGVGKVPAPFNMTVGRQAAVGPYHFDFQFGREFLSSTSLALMTIYQAITFLIFFSRLVLGLMAQRDIEDTAASDREGVLFRGTGWLSMGMKIAAVETALGFASTDFVMVLSRRVLRFLARACVIIGVVKGFVPTARALSCV
jgi:hypothetical protein